MNKQSVELTKTESTLLLITKLWQPKKYNGEIYTWEPDEENRCLNGYDRLVFFYLENYVHDRSMIDIKNINTLLLDLLNKIEPRLCYRVLLDINRHTDNFSSKLNTNQIMFFILYGYVQALQTRDYDGDGKIIDLVKMDGSDVVGFNDDKEDLKELIKVTF